MGISQKILKDVDYLTYNLISTFLCFFSLYSQLKLAFHIIIRGRLAGEVQEGGDICIPVADTCWCMAKVSVMQSCPTLCDIMDYSPGGSSVLGISQERILDWVFTKTRGFHTQLDEGAETPWATREASGVPFLIIRFLWRENEWVHAKALRTISYYYHYHGFPVSSVGKKFACNAGDPNSIPGSGRSAGEG